MGLLHLIFVFIRISILSPIYGYLIYKVLNKNFNLKISKKRYIIPLTFIALFIWRNSYWRNNGYGDYARVPLTSEYEITMIDFSYISLLKNGKDISNKGIIKEIESGSEGGIDELYFENNILYEKSGDAYMIFDTKTTTGKLFNEEEFIKNGGKVKKLMSLSRFHSDYWGWKILFI